MMQHEGAGRKRARHLLARTGYHMGRHGGHFAHGGHSDYAEDKEMISKAMGEHDSQLHPGHHTRLRLADGGVADGEPAPARGDRPARGKGRGARHGDGGGHKVNIIVAPQGGQGPRPIPVPVPARPPIAPGAGAASMPPPPGAGMGPMAGAPVGVGAPGGVPPRPAGLGTPMPPGGAPMLRKDGGRAGMKDGGHTHLHAGSGSGAGRLEQFRHKRGYRAGGECE